MGRLLYLVHCLPPEEYTGTPIVAYGYARALAARGWDVTVVYPSERAVTWTAQPFRRPDEAFTRIEVPPTQHRGAEWSVQAATEDGGAWSQGALTFQRILRRVRPDLVHVVNNVHLPLDLPELAKADGVPVVRSVTGAEDLCGLINPVSPRSGPAGYCTPPLTPEHCAWCVEATYPGAPVAAARSDSWGPAPERAHPAGERGADRGADGVAERHRRLVTRLTRKRARAAAQYQRVFDRVVFPSASFRRFFEATQPLDPSRVHVIPQGMDLVPWPERAPHAADRGSRPRVGQPVTLCLAGTFDPVKGHAAVVEAFTSPALVARRDYRLCCLGGGAPQLVAPLVAANPNVEVRGPYRAEDLPTLLGEFDVGLATSRFETFHRVTREYLLAGLPVIGSRAFGILDVVHDRENGLLFDHADPGSLAATVTALLDDPALLDRLRDGARVTTIRSLEEEVDDLAALYGDLVAEARHARAVGVTASPRSFRRKHALMPLLAGDGSTGERGDD